jgi:transcriptional regulator with XRE-family HTH domain
VIIQGSKTLGPTVQLVREKLGMTQAELAAKLGTDEGEIGALEKGVLFYDYDYSERIADALNVPLNVLALIASNPSELEGVQQTMAEKLRELALKLLEREDPA